MSRYLVFRLYAPLASWGTAAVGEERPSGTYPGRSAIIGLLAAALGIRREETQRLNALAASIRIAVKQYSPGRLLRDYHTVQMPSSKKGRHFFTRRDELNRPNSELNTIVSTRDYRSDGLWTVALAASATAASDCLDKLAAALARPCFILYLGRRACPPAAPLAPEVVEAATWKQALDHEFASLALPGQPATFQTHDVLYAWEGGAAALDGQTNGVESNEIWDEPGNRQRWQFAQRIEYRRYGDLDGGD